MATFKKYTTNKGTFWRFQILVNTDIVTGKRKFKSKSGFATKREAKLAADELESQLHKNGFLDNETITFGEISQQWFDNYKLTVRQTTWNSTRIAFNLHILPFLADKPIASITTLNCQQLVNYWFDKPLVTYKLNLNYMSRIFKYAQNLKIISEDPTTSVIIPRASNQKRKKALKDNFYTLSELKTFLECASKKDYKVYTFFRLLAFSGMRKGEALALNWNDIDFENKTITVNKTQSVVPNDIIIEKPKTKASIRKVYIDNTTANILKNWRQKQKIHLFKCGINSLDKNQLVFPNNNNELMASHVPNYWLNNIINKYQLKKISVHGFRHTYATLAVQGGMPVKELQAQLGHTKVETTLNIYTSVTDEQRQETATKYTSFVNF